MLGLGNWRTGGAGGGGTAMAEPRPASFLPTIKCSNCGDEIEISRLADHVCSISKGKVFQSRMRGAYLGN
jgi:hypothetical protein